MGGLTVGPYRDIKSGELVSDSSTVSLNIGGSLFQPEVNHVLATPSQIKSLFDASLSGSEVTGFGYLFYAHGGTNQLVSNARSQLKVDGAGSEINKLKPPFTAHQFIIQSGGAVFQPFSLDNTYTIEVRLSIIPSL